MLGKHEGRRHDQLGEYLIGWWTLWVLHGRFGVGLGTMVSQSCDLGEDEWKLGLIRIADALGSRSLELVRPMTARCSMMVDVRMRLVEE